MANTASIIVTSLLSLFESHLRETKWIMLDGFGINITQLTGLLWFAAAVMACVIAARRSDRRDAWVWWGLAFTNGLFLVEVYIGLRHRIHDHFVARLIADGEYGQRQGAQELIIISLATMALICGALFVASRRLGGGAVRIAASLTIALVVLFAVETVSLHALDAIYYRPIGPVLLVGWLWAIAASGICLAASAVKG